MPIAYVVLLVSNLVFATGYTVSRIVLEDMGPATLAMTRLAKGATTTTPPAITAPAVSGVPAVHPGGTPESAGQTTSTRPG